MMGYLPGNPYENMHIKAEVAATYALAYEQRTTSLVNYLDHLVRNGLNDEAQKVSKEIKMRLGFQWR